jgi:hypothetical protein
MSILYLCKPIFHAGDDSFSIFEYVVTELNFRLSPRYTFDILHGHHDPERWVRYAVPQTAVASRFTRHNNTKRPKSEILKELASCQDK